jgi:Protein of unknown function (DUF2809)
MVPSEDTAPSWRRRLCYAGAAVAFIVAGLTSRSPVLGLPWVVAKHGGSVIWGTMMFFAAAAVLPTARLALIAVITAVVAAGVEFSQLLHVPWLDDFRRTTFGMLLLGRTFSWWDIVSYWIGIAIGCGLAATAARRRI